MSFIDFEIKKEYRSLSDNVITDFYIPLLNDAVMYKRAVGFFSSSALIEITKGILGLIKNGGKIQLVASPRLSEEDIEAIEKGFKERQEVIEGCIKRSFEDPKTLFEERRLNLLANLIANGQLDIKIAFLESNNTIGMFHEKMGLMYDKENNVIAFSGSMNESSNAFSHNYETIDVYCSWTQDSDRVFSKESAFKAIWNDYEPHIKTIDFPEIGKEILLKYKKDNSIEACFEEELLTPPIIQNEEIPVTREPFIPTDVTIRPYQTEAIDAWENNGFVGIFDMATGTGKTYTGLAAVERLFVRCEKKLAVYIVCPYQHLVDQWVEDIEKFGMKPIIGHSASAQKDWKKRLKNGVIAYNCNVSNILCFVCTNATFSSEFVQKELLLTKGNVLLMVDEAHNFGAENLRTLLQPQIPFRLAMSATIERYEDEEGTKKIFDYFGKKCIEYSLKQAIDNDMLTPYKYYPIVVSLIDQERDEYIEITKKIFGHSDEDGKHKLSEYEKMLLIQRARIVAGAVEKIQALREQIEKYKQDTHMLVYCGATTIRDPLYKEGSADDEEKRQVNIVSEMLGNELGMNISKFTSEEPASEREALKKAFAEGKHIQALVAIRCLDEGVNIPSIKTAFILASSTNPKEYIQRRGRVLRKYPGKTFAVIYDFITLPIALSAVSNYSPETIQSVKGLARREITRMKDFASISQNPWDVDKLINEIEDTYQLSGK